MTNVASGTTDEAPACLDAAFGPKATKNPFGRGEILRRAFEVSIDRVDEIARLVTPENGKAGNDAIDEAKYAFEFFRRNAEEAVRADGHLGLGPATGARLMVHQKPVSISVLAASWNNLPPWIPASLTRHWQQVARLSSSLLRKRI